MRRVGVAMCRFHGLEKAISHILGIFKFKICVICATDMHGAFKSGLRGFGQFVN